MKITIKTVSIATVVAILASCSTSGSDSSSSSTDYAPYTLCAGEFMRDGEMKAAAWCGGTDTTFSGCDYKQEGFATESACEDAGDKWLTANGYCTDSTCSSSSSSSSSGSLDLSHCSTRTYQPWDDIQVDSECQVACAYKAGGQYEGVEAACKIISAWGLDTSDCPACR